MLGFVSALSSALAVIILIMSIMLVNLLKSAFNNSAEKSTVEVNTKTVTRIAGMSVDTSGLKLDYNIVTSNIIDNIKSNPKIKEVDVFCTYGNNLSKDLADKYVTFNVVILKKSLPDIVVNYQKPMLLENDVNYCRVTYKNEE